MANKAAIMLGGEIVGEILRRRGGTNDWRERLTERVLRIRTEQKRQALVLDAILKAVTTGQGDPAALQRIAEEVEGATRALKESGNALGQAVEANQPED